MAKSKAFRRAEQKIEEARRSDATTLDLDEMHLAALPESLGRLTQLNSLNASRNKLTALPESLGYLVGRMTVPSPIGVPQKD